MVQNPNIKHGLHSNGTLRSKIVPYIRRNRGVQFLEKALSSKNCTSRFSEVYFLRMVSLVCTYDFKNTWFTGQFRSTKMKDSRRRVISHAFGWERRHYCYSERPCIAIRSNNREINWFTGQFRTTNMKDSWRRGISHALGWGRRHYCNSDGPCVSIRSNDRIANIITSEDEQARRTIPILSQAPGDHFPHTQGC